MTSREVEVGGDPGRPNDRQAVRRSRRREGTDRIGEDPDRVWVLTAMLDQSAPPGIGPEDGGRYGVVTREVQWRHPAHLFALDDPTGREVEHQLGGPIRSAIVGGRSDQARNRLVGQDRCFRGWMETDEGEDDRAADGLLPLEERDALVELAPRKRIERVHLRDNRACENDAGSNGKADIEVSRHGRGRSGGSDTLSRGDRFGNVAAGTDEVGLDKIVR